MQTDRRLTVLESCLPGQERLILWLKKAQALGGFFDHCRTDKAPFLIEDEKTAFLFNLVNRCNVEVLEVKGSPVTRLFALYLLRLVCSKNVEAHEVELQEIPVVLQGCLVQGLALDVAIKCICNEHFGGSQVLFQDIQEALSIMNQKCARLRDCYNAIAPKLGYHAIEEGEIQATVVSEARRKADLMIRLSRAKAVADFGNLHEARELLLPLIEPSTDNSKTR